MALDDNESDALIGSDKVEGTAVYGADGNKVGTIERLMIDKTYSATIWVGRARRSGWRVSVAAR
ncbi:hypothetical protein ABIE93_005483 [Bradyrhizobium elkanii]